MTVRLILTLACLAIAAPGYTQEQVEKPTVKELPPATQTNEVKGVQTKEAKPVTSDDTVSIKKTELTALQERATRVPELEQQLRGLVERLVIAESASARLAADLVTLRLRMAQIQTAPSAKPPAKP